MGDEGYKSDDGSRPIGGGDTAIGRGDNPMGDKGIAASWEGPAGAISISVSSTPAGAVWRDEDEYLLKSKKSSVEDEARE